MACLNLLAYYIKIKESEINTAKHSVEKKYIAHFLLSRFESQ